MMLQTISASTHYVPRVKTRSSGVPKKKPVRVLLIEDNRSDVFLLSRMLRDSARGETFSITDVSRLSDALRVLDRQSFDVVILDLGLGDIDGVASVAALHAEIPAMPIIVYSGNYDEKIRSEALMCGARHFLVKGRESAFSLQFMIRQALACHEEE